MGLNKSRRPTMAPGNRVSNISTGVSTGTTLQPDRTYTINAPAADATWNLATPTRKGDVTTVHVDTNSTKVVTVRTESSAVTFFGSTKDALAVSTGQAGVTLRFTSLSTTKYAVEIVSRSTAAPVTASASTR